MLFFTPSGIAVVRNSLCVRHHVQGLVHRDIKPSNILYRDNQAYLTDWGHMQQCTDVPHTGCTTIYAAPEVCGESWNSDTGDTGHPGCSACTPV